MDPAKISRFPVSRYHPQQGANLNHIEMRVYTDGACMNNGKRNATCGSGIWIDEDHSLNKALKIPERRQSNQVGELVATIAATDTLLNYCDQQCKGVHSLMPDLGLFDSNGLICLRSGFHQRYEPTR